jgi:hemerythrin-like domain-containing protein
MPEHIQQNFSESLVLVHKTISRGLKVILEKSPDFSLQCLKDPECKRGFVSYVRSFIAVMKGHHQSEDQVVFPYMLKLIPDAPYDQLASEHRWLLGILRETDTIIDNLAAGNSKSLDHLAGAMTRLDKVWWPHREKEENFFNDAILEKLMGAEEHERMIRLVMESSRDNSIPEYLAIPFMLYNLPEKERALMSEELPDQVTEKVGSGSWKEKWAPMQPFLLP